MVYCGTMSTLRELLQGNKARHGLDFLAFSDYVSPKERAETSFRYGRDFSDKGKADGADVVGSRYLVGSDYSGGSLVRANRRAVLEILGEESPLIVRAHGGYNTEAIYFRLDVDDENAAQALKILAGLENYPVVSDDVLSTVEHEEQETGWESYGAQDFRKALEARHGLENGFLADDVGTFGELFAIADNGSGLVEHEENDGSPYFRTEQAAERIPAAFLFYVAKIDEDFRAGAELALSEPDEARRILRMVRMGETLRALERELARTLAYRVDPENGPRNEQARHEARRIILDATVDEGSTLSIPDIERKVDRSFRLTFKRWRFNGPTETLSLDFDPFDTGASVADAIAPIAALFSK